MPRSKATGPSTTLVKAVPLDEVIGESIECVRGGVRLLLVSASLPPDRQRQLRAQFIRPRRPSD